MPTITVKDGAKIFYKDWGAGQPVVFSHGWPLSADAWDEQLFFMASNGFRAIAHDRRGHGRSTQTFAGNDMDTYADDLATLTDTLDLHDAIHVGHSTGGGEVVHYIGRHGVGRVAKAVLIDAVPPGLVHTDQYGQGIPIKVFDDIRAGLLADRSQYFMDLAQAFYGANRPNSKVSQGVLEAFWRICMQCGFAAVYDCVKAFSETDFHGDLAKLSVPTLIIHGDDDQVVPIDVGGRRTVKLVKNAKLLEYPGAPHGLMSTHRDRLHKDLLEFARGAAQGAPGRRGSSEPASRAARGAE